MTGHAEPAPPSSRPNQTVNATPAPERRLVLRTAGLAGGLVGAALLTGCGSSGSSAPAKSGGLEKAKVPVGGGTVDADLKAVVTQPTAGQFKAFSSTCTHQGCQVTQVQDGKILCPCHGSAFSIKDGSVLQGPATKALPARTVTVEGGTITVS
ncbi:Rieske (2Fe-2S) protein [Flexivirga meconopsidis]|uniref:Rieske (2Fe-2S) protein n=1 Tax=Flexivirga meconopsidis TaxID=2977121 RepID=UPI002240A28E|nr:Rieske (2Fe-2S) protein [Flexivirga meconopsidis]